MTVDVFGTNTKSFVEEEKIANGKTVLNHVSPDDFPGRKLVGIDGKWYDVTYFLPHHPGGEILEHFIGKDATAAFHSWGHLDGTVLKRYKPVGTYERKITPLEADVLELREELKANGYFKTDFRWYAIKIIICAMTFISAIVMTVYGSSWIIRQFGAVMMTGCFQQCGFMVHDLMHTQMFRKRHLDHKLGTLFGNVVFGLGSHWWRDEHYVHHSLTNSVYKDQWFADPQMWEGAWAQSTKLQPLMKWWFQKYLVKIQHITFIPMVTIFGRFTILIEGILAERRWFEIVGFALHFTWMAKLLSYLPSWNEIITYYMIICIVEGVLHFQLIFSHYCKPFFYPEEIHNMSWYEYQIQTTLNISNPWWLDWFHGGLNFHIEHHMFPTMGRNYLRKASHRLREVIEKNNLVYDSATFTGAMVRTLYHLKESSVHYSLDPR